MKVGARVMSCLALAVAAALPLAAASAPRAVSPQIAIGPKAQPAGQASPSYGLFTCQVGLSSATCYDPYQMRRAYGTDKLINAGFDGSGHTIVIVDAFGSPTIDKDVGIFSSFYGLPSASLTKVFPQGPVNFDPTDANMVGWAAETTLDVEWAHAIAPKANIVLVVAKTNNDDDILGALRYAVDHNLGDVISMSFGENESCVDSTLLAAYHDVFADATRKNITLFASSGDDGAAQQTCDEKSWVRAVSHPASDPLVSGVGGTELHAAGYCLPQLGCNPATAPAFGTWQGEIVWNEFDSAATGGGVSVLFDAPPYQKSALNATGRAVPDVAYNAAIEHGVLVYWSAPDAFGGEGFWLFGGTSAGSPQWAGILAISNQVAGKRLGYLNSAFYQLGQTPPNYGASFHDITSGNNSVIEEYSMNQDVVIAGFVAGTGYDATTGIGSPKVDGLVGRLIQRVSPGDGVAAIATSKPHGGNKGNKGAMQPH
jgi:subtilase family serine protease